MKKIYFILIIMPLIFVPSLNFARETEIYADNIDYDSEGNIVAKGNVKIIDGDEIINSNLIIVNQKEDIIILPKEFYYKDEQDNYYYGSSGEFTTNFENGEVNDVKILLNDGSRIVGTKAIKKGKLDLINKGVFSPCRSKIRIKKFICPIWQVEGEKILHDRDKLFIHTKHAKMRLFNTPVYYFPYMINPSPLRKKRKSGFLNPKISFNFLETKTVQQLATPYYFALDEDKELLLTPTLNYGGGVDASQRITYKYNQLISGGILSVNASTDTNLENQNNESWLRDASIIINLDQNLNENYNMSITSALQTSPTYLRRTDQNNILNRKNSLNTTFNLNGFEIIEPNDTLEFTIAGYQVVKNNEDNKTTPTSLPYTQYNSGSRNFKGNVYKNHLTFYNIFRDKATSEHAQQQQKMGYNLKSQKVFYSLFSKLTFKTELHTQFYNIENKKINSENYKGTYSRAFPMTGLYFETPLVNRKYNFYVTPKLFTVINSSQSNSNKISNEDSTDYKYDILNYSLLNRFNGTDKLDNSRRIGYGLNMNKDRYSLELGQNYEFNISSNDIANKVGLYDYMSDLLASAKYDGINNKLHYESRLNVDQGLMKSQNLSLSNNSIIGDLVLSYSQTRKEVNEILKTGSETLNIGYQSEEFINYSSIYANSTFDLLNDDPTNYQFGYKYLDECFGINLDFERSFYEDRDLKPKDIFTLMFSFKHLGSYKSTNLAVSELDKQDIRWISDSVNEENFK